jgi:hypothetical protein
MPNFFASALCFSTNSFCKHVKIHKFNGM